MDLKKDDLPLVSVIIPCRNEGGFIRKCLDSVLAQDYPKESFEILVVDGASTDGTAEIIRSYAGDDKQVRYFENPKEITPCALNIGIKNARGNFIIWLSAHNEYDSMHISKCIKYIKEFNADAVGCVIKSIPRENTFIGKAICLALSHPFGVGASLHKTGISKPQWVDAAFGTCYKKEIFKQVGLFNEKLIRGQDMEFNLRLKKAGFKILLAPDIVSFYHARSDLASFISHNFLNGVWAIYPFIFSSQMPVSLRHLVPLGFVLSLILPLVLCFFTSLLKLLYWPGIFLYIMLFVLGLYFLINIYSSALITIREKDLRYLFIMPLVFAGIHISYGLGSLWGLLNILLGRGSRRANGLKET